jgi:ribonuclease R
MRQRKVGKKKHPAKRRSYSGRTANRSRRKRTDRPATVMLADEILQALHRHGKPISRAELFDKLELHKSMHKAAHAALRELCRQKTIICSSGNRYSLPVQGKPVEARVEMHPRGFGFALLEDGSGPQSATEKKDPFIAPENLATAGHGDRVMVRIFSSGRGRKEAEVVEILERKRSIITGIYRSGRGTGLVFPEDARFQYQVVVKPKDDKGAGTGQAVLVEITEYLPDQRNPLGKIIEVLGDPEDLSVQTMMVIREFDLPDQFDSAVLTQADNLPDQVSLSGPRQDLRHIPHITIDGESARDFDDAVAIEQTDKGYRLYVSIADVSHYIQPGTPLDLDAYRRGTSVYFPTRVIPMLPERLSNNLCSLVPNQDRLAFTAILDFDQQGRETARKFTKSIIQSRHRMTYTQVKKIVVDKEPTVRRQFKDMTVSLELMNNLALALEKKRLKRGSIGFTIPEPEILFNEQGTLTDIIRAERNQAHKIIEEFMLAANEAVATTFTEKGLALLYRIHEVPKAEKVIAFTEFASTMGLDLPGATGSPQWFGQVLSMVADTPKEYIVNNLLLRTMQRARYSPKNVGHFGLAAPNYAHFTSPIRRYPDLMVHRALAELINMQTSAQPEVRKGYTTHAPEPLAEAGDHLSAREQNAVEAERALSTRMQAKFMADKIGESFDGIISGITSFGFFVELIDHFVSGAVPIHELKDDYYHFDEKNHRLVGNRTKNIFQMGDLVRIKVASVDRKQKHINFVLD